jgi:D-arabinose 1-dehydrogenase-like Zn-dependent alcohol dehydrogenase
VEIIRLKTEGTGYSKAGGCSEYKVAPAASCCQLPEHLPMYAMALILYAGVDTHRAIEGSGAVLGE